MSAVNLVILLAGFHCQIEGVDVVLTGLPCQQRILISY